MPQPAIQFYHLLTTPLERALPKLMEKAHGVGMRVVVQGTSAQVASLDTALWTYNPNGFLPHGTAADPRPERQPIYLTDREENPNGAELLVIADGRSIKASEPESGITRIFDMFDGGDESAVTQARARWKSYKDQGFALTYIKQKDDGGWEKVMSTEAEAAGAQ